MFFLLVGGLCAQDEYSFDLSEIKKNPLHFGGYMEFRPTFFGLDEGSSLYALRFYDEDVGKTISEYALSALVDVAYETGIMKARLRTNTMLFKSFSGWSGTASLYEAFLSIKPSLSLTIEIGKKRLKWGKGYAWNPAAYFDRIKNPNDPDLALEGFTVISLEFVKSFSGRLKTIALNPVLFPVFKDLNGGFGEEGFLNIGGRIYLLLFDTDIDLMFLAKGSLSSRYGFDFSRNLSSNFEIHGELSHIPDNRRQVYDPAGGIREIREKITSFLLGVRYLNTFNTTYFLEYYKNGTGLYPGEIGDYYSLIEQAHAAYALSGDEERLILLKGGLSSSYRTFAPMRDYLFLRITQKEPGNILYFNPSLTGIINVNDGSFSLAPEFLYTPLTNLELRAKFTALFGKTGSEFSEKQNTYRVEFRARYFF